MRQEPPISNRLISIIGWAAVTLFNVGAAVVSTYFGTQRDITEQRLEKLEGEIRRVGDSVQGINLDVMRLKTLAEREERREHRQ